MDACERRLLRKQIDLKLYIMANKEAQENDFLNSSQMITERQQMYMIISQAHRRSENKNIKKKQFAFPIENTSLPHVNLGKINRVRNSVKKIIKNKKELSKVFEAHSFRTATPFYTNPKLTVDRGNFMNYSQHIGVLLHTPHYIEFIKTSSGADTSEIEHSKKEGVRNQKMVAETSPRFLSSISSSSSVVSSRSDSTFKDFKEIETSSYSGVSSRSTETRSSTSLNKKQKTTKSSISERKNSISPLDFENQTKDFEERNQVYTSVSSHTSENESKLSITSKNDGENSKDSEDCSEKSKKTYSNKSSFKENSNQQPQENLSPKHSLKREETFSSRESNFSESSTPKQKTEGSESPVFLREIGANSDNNVVTEVMEFLQNQKTDQDEFQSIESYFNTVFHYRDSKPDYVKDYCQFLLDRNKTSFEMFSKIINKYLPTNITHEEAVEINHLLKIQGNSYENNDAEMSNVTLNGNQGNNTESSPINDLESKEDFARSFNDLYRRSIGEMDEKDINTIQRMIYKLERSDAQWEWSDDEDYTNEVVVTSYRDLFRNSVGSISKSDIDVIKSKFSNEKKEIEEEKDEEEEEEEKKEEMEEGEEANNDDDFVESFNNLYRNSVGEMDEKDMNTIQKMIYKLERSDAQWEWSDDDDYTNEAVVTSYRDFFRNSVGSISKSDIDKIKSKFSNEKKEIDEEKDEEEEEEKEDSSNNDDDFAESFNNLYRNSVGEMDEKDMYTIQKMIEKLENPDAQWEWSDDDDYTNEAVVTSYRDFFRNSVGSISKSDIDIMKSKFSNEKKEIEEENDEEEEEEKEEEEEEKEEEEEEKEDSSNNDDDFAESFNNLYRNSVGEMDEKDVNTIQKMIEKLENPEAQWEWSDDDDYTNEAAVTSFRDFFRNSVGSISKSDIDKIKSKFSHKGDIKERSEKSSSSRDGSESSNP